MPHRIIQLFLLTVTLLSASLTAYAADIRQGEWELMVKQSVNGMPSGMGGFEWRECLNQAHPIPTAYIQARNCDVLESHVVYHTLHFKMSCYSENGTITSEGKVRFGDLKMDGDAKSGVGSAAGNNMVVWYKFEGRRIGDCQSN